MNTATAANRPAEALGRALRDMASLNAEWTRVYAAAMAIAYMSIEYLMYQPIPFGLPIMLLFGGYLLRAAPAAAASRLRSGAVH